MRLLVCGGRDFSDVPLLWSALDKVHAKHGVEWVIHGSDGTATKQGTLGAGYWAGQWAIAREVCTMGLPTEWEQHGDNAVTVRNEVMLNGCQPTHAIAMEGGQGTAHMVGLLKAAGVPVWEIASARK